MTTTYKSSRLVSYSHPLVVPVVAISSRQVPQLRSILHKDQLDGIMLMRVLSNSESTLNKVVDALVACLGKMFSSVDSAVLSATKLTDLSTWPASFDDSTQGMLLILGT